MIKVNWRDRILEQFTPHAARLALVADPDNLLTEEDIAQKIQTRGFETLLYEDSISFRFIYESRYRSRWQDGSLSDLIVIVPSQPSELESLPFDLLKESDRRLSFSLNELFPNLSYPVLSTLDRNLLDPLYAAILEHQPDHLNDIETQDFILCHVFRIVSESIKEDSDLLHCLLRLHYKEQRLPDLLSDRLITILCQKPQFQKFPLKAIVPNRPVFLQFLQENWNSFAQQQILRSLPDSLASELSTSYGEVVETFLPFDHKDVWAFMDNLFREGYLKPANPMSLGFPGFEPKSNDLFRIGLYIDSLANQKYRFSKLLQLINESVPNNNAHHREWFSVAYRWAELLVLWHQINMNEEPELISEFYDIQKELDTAFLNWVQERYNTLHYQSPTNPAMLHHLPLFLARHIYPQNKQKVALVLMDGLALDQWLIIRKGLAEQKPQWRFQEEAVFALIPTITSVSRQAVFAGKTPIGFANSIQANNKESSLWQQFWIDQGFKAGQVGYKAGLRDEQHLEKAEELISHPAMRILGLVVPKVDRISHSKESYTPSMHEQIRPWVQQGFLTRMLNSLLENNFQVFLTADHGNIEATGIGRPSEGAIAEYRGERVRIYSETALRAKVKERFPTAIAWDSPILPPNYLPLLAPNRSAFIEDEKIVAHGGISMEELIVPFVQIRQ
ncbi:BREX-3 system phosphatase PglZ [Oscillatoria sp. FACHB-1407]|uniref:BREX-3 system phosphatase PglZ n=1 Tax=Oscillatoria sp. FACHB-1407 TaxID=2692847 RepID=UPI0016880E25|nr:BREX-3 system phosphatase PglZ [Oscillatoria sp. FACHB-1407]MBD2463212.1 BREX-3 system phosphatase PglZ [Oscillatoria sp. FACHB-1407]